MDGLIDGGSCGGQEPELATRARDETGGGFTRNPCNARNRVSLSVDSEEALSGLRVFRGDPHPTDYMIDPIYPSMAGPDDGDE
jgi:hypothetical protein